MENETSVSANQLSSTSFLKALQPQILPIAPLGEAARLTQPWQQTFCFIPFLKLFRLSLPLRNLTFFSSENAAGLNFRVSMVSTNSKEENVQVPQQPPVAHRRSVHTAIKGSAAFLGPGAWPIAYTHAGLLSLSNQEVAAPRGVSRLLSA